MSKVHKDTIREFRNGFFRNENILSSPVLLQKDDERVIVRREAQGIMGKYCLSYLSLCLLNILIIIIK